MVALFGHLTAVTLPIITGKRVDNHIIGRPYHLLGSLVSQSKASLSVVEGIAD